MLGKIVKIKASDAGGKAQMAYLKAVEYYNAGAEGHEPAYFFGSAAARLGILGQAKNFEQIQRLAQGFHPTTGKPIVQGAGAGHTQGWDLTFSAGKSVSTLFAVASPELQARIKDAHEKCVKAALAYLEEGGIAISREGKMGCIKTTAEIVAACFNHNETRALDPLLHTHAMLLNIGFRNDKFGCLATGGLYRSALTIGQVYQTQMADELKKMGFQVELKELNEGVIAEIAGVPEDIQKTFSKRTKEIDDWLVDHDFDEAGWAAKKVAAAASRSGKVKGPELALDTLQAHWVSEAQESGHTEQTVLASCKQALVPLRARYAREDAFKLMESRALENLGSTFSEADVFRAVMECGIGRMSLDLLKEEARSLCSELVSLGHDENGQRRYTTPNILDMESAILGWALTHKDSQRHRVNDEAIFKVLADFEAKKGFRLNSEQLDGVRHILGNGALATIQGKAGTGKSTMLEAARMACESQGFKMIGCAVASKAADGLREVGIQSDNVAKLLSKLKRRKIIIDEKTIVVVDEAGMLGTAQGNSLQRWCANHGAKLVLVGDTEQLQAIGAGGIHGLAVSKLGTVELREIQRQKTEEDRKIVLSLEAGQAQDALADIRKQGRLTVLESGKVMVKQISADFLDSAEPLKEKVVIAETRRMVREINNEIRTLRVQRNEIGQGANVEIYDPNADASFATFVAAGDRIGFMQASKADMGLMEQGAEGDWQPIKEQAKNGMAAMVVAVDTIGASFEITAKLDDGRTVRWNSDKFNAWSLAYARTAHRSQGETVNHAFYAATNPDKHKAYVAGSRHRTQCRFYTIREAEDSLAHRMSQSARNKTATEILEDYQRAEAKREEAKLFLSRAAHVQAPPAPEAEKEPEAQIGVGATRRTAEAPALAIEPLHPKQAPAPVQEPQTFTLRNVLREMAASGKRAAVFSIVENRIDQGQGCTLIDRDGRKIRAELGHQAIRTLALEAEAQPGRILNFTINEKGVINVAKTIEETRSSWKLLQEREERRRQEAAKVQIHDEPRPEPTAAPPPQDAPPPAPVVELDAFTQRWGVSKHELESRALSPQELGIGLPISTAPAFIKTTLLLSFVAADGGRAYAFCGKGAEKRLVAFDCEPASELSRQFEQLADRHRMRTSETAKVVFDQQGHIDVGLCGKSVKVALKGPELALEL